MNEVELRELELKAEFYETTHQYTKNLKVRDLALEQALKAMQDYQTLWMSAESSLKKIMGLLPQAKKDDFQIRAQEVLLEYIEDLASLLKKNDSELNVDSIITELKDLMG